MDRTPNIEGAEVVEVGRFYMVPTIIHLRALKQFRVVPVIGPLHEDAKFIKVPYHHWHPDRRFVSTAWMKKEGSNHWATIFTPFPPMQKKSDGPIVIDGGRRRLKCRRLVGSFCNPFGDTPPRWLNEMEQAYKNERLRDGHICPHRGISCRGVVAESDGVVCPGHGLKWGFDGRLVSRLGKDFLTTED